MLYDYVKKLLSKSKLPKDFKSNFTQKTGFNTKDLAITEKKYYNSTK